MLAANTGPGTGKKFSPLGGKTQQGYSIFVVRLSFIMAESAIFGHRPFFTLESVTSFHHILKWYVIGTHVFFSLRRRFLFDNRLSNCLFRFSSGYFHGARLSGVQAYLRWYAGVQ